jgi:hypothetical protein
MTTRAKKAVVSRLGPMEEGILGPAKPALLVANHHVRTHSNGEAVGLKRR